MLRPPRSPAISLRYVVVPAGPAWRRSCVHTVVAERADALLGFYRLAGEAPVPELADLFVDR